MSKVKLKISFLILILFLSKSFAEDGCMEESLPRRKLLQVEEEKVDEARLDRRPYEALPLILAQHAFVIDSLLQSAEGPSKKT